MALPFIVLDFVFFAWTMFGLRRTLFYLHQKHHWFKFQVLKKLGLIVVGFVFLRAILLTMGLVGFFYVDLWPSSVVETSQFTLSSFALFLAAILFRPSE